MPQLIKDTFMVSIYRAQDNKLYFDDVYLGIPIEITEDQFKKLVGSDPLTSEGKEVILEFAKMYNEEHIIPASIYGRKEPIVNDLHNVLPVITFLNDLRSNLDIRPIQSKVPPTTYCYDRNIDKIKKVSKISILRGCVNVESTNHNPAQYSPRENTKYVNNEHVSEKYIPVSCHFGNCTFQPATTEYLGLIARTVLYFNDKYAKHEHVSENLYSKYMPSDRILLMKIWDSTYPPTYYEFQRHARIQKKTQVSNKYFEEAMKRMYGENKNWMESSRYTEYLNNLD